MTDHSGQSGGRIIHTIPVPLGWSIEQSWEAIRRGDLLTHPRGEPTWANVETDADDHFIGVLLAEED